MPKSLDDATDSCDVVPFLGLLHSFRGEHTGCCLSVKKVKNESPGDGYITLLLFMAVDIKVVLSELD